MSPEQCGTTELTPATDWYAVGVVLYEALTGHLPFDCRGLGMRDVAELKRTELPPHPCSENPSAPCDLADLALDLLNPDPARRPLYSDIVHRLDGSVQIRSYRPGAVDALIGRELELQALQAALFRARAGAATIALVSGRSGMGKSALVQRFLDEASKSGALILAGRCYEREQLPFKAFDQLMDSLSLHLSGLGPDALAQVPPGTLRALGRIFPVLGRVEGVARDDAQPAQSTPLQQRRAAFRALRELARHLAKTQPLILYIDDLQWGDLDSAPLFAELLRGPDAPPLLLVCSYRSEDEASSSLITALKTTYLPEAGVGEPTVVQLGGLSHESSVALATALLDGTEGAEFAAREAEGSPFFLHELTAYIRAQGLHAAKQLRLDGLLEARLRRLPDDCRWMMSVVAAAGRPEQRGIVAQAAALGEAVIGAMRTLEAEHLLYSSGPNTTDRVEAYHDRIRETAYRLLPTAERKTLHERLAVALEQAQEQDVEALLEHWDKAGARTKAGGYAVRAAERATTALAFGRAAELYRCALDLSPPDRKRAAELRESLGRVLALAGRGIEAATAFFSCLDDVPVPKAMELRGLAISHLMRAGRLDQALQELKRAKDLTGVDAPESKGDALRALLRGRLRIRLHGLRWRRRDAEQTAPEVLHRMDLLWALSSCLITTDNLKGLVYQSEHLYQALKTGEPCRLSRALGSEAAMKATQNKPASEVEWLLARALEQAGMSGEPEAMAVANGTHAIARFVQGRYVEARAYAQRSLEIHRGRLHSTHAWDIAIMAFYDLRAAAFLGDFDALVRQVPELLRDAEDRGDLYASVTGRSGRCNWAWLIPDQPELAREQVELAQRQWVQDGYHLQHFYTTQALGEIALYEGNPEPMLERLLAEWKALFFLRRIQHARTEVLYLRARLRLALARRRTAPSLVAEAKADAEAIAGEAQPWTLAAGRLLQGAVASLSRPREAARILREAEGQFDVLQMQPWAAACRLRRGEWLGGEDGQTLYEEGAQQLRALGVAAPDRFARVLVP